MEKNMSELPKRSLGGMVLHSGCLHLDLDREDYNRTQQRSTLSFNTSETSPGCYLGFGSFSPGLPRSSQSHNRLPIQSHPSHLLGLQLIGPVCSKAIHQLKHLLLNSSLMSLSTLVLMRWEIYLAAPVFMHLPSYSLLPNYYYQKHLQRKTKTKQKTLPTSHYQINPCSEAPILAHLSFLSHHAR